MNSKVVTIRLPEWLAAEMDIDAAIEGLSRTEFIKFLYLAYKEHREEINNYISYMAEETAERF